MSSSFSGSISSSISNQMSKFVIGTFTLSTTGNFSVSSLAFSPKLLHIMYLPSSSATVSVHGHGWGDASSEWSSYIDVAETASSTTNIIYYVDSSSVLQIAATINSLDASGFTLNVGTYGTPTQGGVFGYIAFG